MKKQPTPPKKKLLPLLIVGAVLAVPILLTVLQLTTGLSWPANPQMMVESHDPERLRDLSAQTCRACHQEEYEKWKDTHHHLANRPIRPEIDDKSFHPPQTITHGGSTYRFERDGDSFKMVVTGKEGEAGSYQLDGALGVMPLRQYLFEHQPDKWQTTPMAWDPRHKEWFSVFEEEREPHDWGHWLGQGMNWNANCAYCHMTDFNKNYHRPTNTYRSTWLAQGISCVQCHAGMRKHVQDARAGRPAPVARHSEQQVTESCATCHSRREHLTKEAFKPGDSFHDHFRLVLPTQPGIYHADGQVLEEDFEYGSFLMSKMGQKGVTCSDCHDTHSLATVLPVKNNALCLKCHGSGQKDATIINPTEHSHHPPESTGNSCVSCHMPTTAFMVRHDRHDHGFISPDPLLTRELGIPNSCNRCHTDKTVEWAEEWTNTWYGEKMESRRRMRARVVARAHNGDPAVLGALLRAAREEENDAWRSTLDSLLGPWAANPVVRQHLASDLEHPHPLVRSAAVRSLAATPRAGELLRPKLDDPSRLVRIDAAFALRGQIDPKSRGRAELIEYLEMNSDSALGAFRAAELHLGEDNPDQAVELARHALTFEPKNPAIIRGSAVILSRAGRNDEAVRQLRKAVDAGIQDAPLLFSLGLLHAETGRSADAIQALEQAIDADPRSVRAYFNLALLHLQEGDAAQALQVIDEGEKIAPTDPDIVHAKASILQRLGRHSEARRYIERLER